MSATTSSTGIGAPDTATDTAPVEERIETARRFTKELLATGEPMAVDELVAGVLGRAHHPACANAAPDEARMILRLAHLFADELGKTTPQFDRLRFIEAAVEEPA
jgi:hypothetical protein